MASRALRSTTIFRQVVSAACLLLFMCGQTTVFGQSKTYRPPPNYVQFGKPDQKEGRRILEDFRQRGLAGDYFLSFELRVMPRRGEGRTVPGVLWGGRNDRGPIMRVVLSPGAADEQRLLVQNGPQNALWQWKPDSGPAGRALPPESLFAPLAGTDLTPFDLQMPFLYWDDFVFEGVAPLSSRPAHVFLLYPPPEVAARKPDLAGVRVYLDTGYNALVRAELIGAENRVLKSTRVRDLKKVDDQWMVKQIDVRNEETRDATRFAVTGAALGLDFAPAVFEPESLGENITPPPPARIRAMGQ